MNVFFSTKTGAINQPLFTAAQTHPGLRSTPRDGRVHRGEECVETCRHLKMIWSHMRCCEKKKYLVHGEENNLTPAQWRGLTRRLTLIAKKKEEETSESSGTKANLLTSPGPTSCRLHVNMTVTLSLKHTVLKINPLGGHKRHQQLF